MIDPEKNVQQLKQNVKKTVLNKENEKVTKETIENRISDNKTNKPKSSEIK